MIKLKELNIVIAEDDLDDALVVKGSFEKHPSFVNVAVVHNGQELLEHLRENDLRPDVVLTDINMPIVNGFEAVTEILEDPLFSGIPCFVYSTSINPVYKAKSDELGVAGFLIKPYTIEEFDAIPEEIVAILSKQA
jgi:CheY-like chemotaxis protein